MRLFLLPLLFAFVTELRYTTSEQTNELSESLVSRMDIVDGGGQVILDPSVQHIPINPAQTHLRPPPPVIRRPLLESDIFIGLSAFRDGYRCGKTIFTAFKRATNPERLYFGVVDQVTDTDLKCLDEYCKMATAEWPDKGACPYMDHIRVDRRDANLSRGPTLARHFQQKLIRDEEFCLQLDAHSLFTNKWDEYLLAEWARIGNEMAVMSTYLHHMHDFIKPNGDNTYPGSYPHLCTTTRPKANHMVRNVGASMITGAKFPQLQALWGAGLSFSKCHAEKRVLIDSHTLWMFDGEEFLRASHLWTHGYDIYSPSEFGCVIYHNYTSVAKRFESVKVDAAVRDRERIMAENRFKLIVGEGFQGLVDTLEMDKYAFGKARTFDEYKGFANITFGDGSVTSNSCNQLHWVPYSNPSEVERVVGTGWTMYPPPTEAPTTTTPEPTTTITTTTVAPTVASLSPQNEIRSVRNFKRQEDERKEFESIGNSRALLWFSLIPLLICVMLVLSNKNVQLWLKRSVGMKSPSTSK